MNERSGYVGEVGREGGVVPGRISQHRQETTPQAVRTDWKYRIPLNMLARKQVRYVRRMYRSPLNMSVRKRIGMRTCTGTY
jgi:hypothetical protein